MSGFSRTVYSQGGGREIAAFFLFDTVLRLPNGYWGVMTDRAAKLAALVNGLVMALLPLAYMVVVGSLVSESSNGSTTVRPSGAPGPASAAVSLWLQMWKILLPLSIIAGWRTFVYARRWSAREDRTWRAVFESGVCGFLYMMLVLARGIATQPMNAPPYVIVYGGIAFLVGLVVGLVLRTTALLVLRVCGRLLPDQPLQPTSAAGVSADSPST